MGWSWGSCGSSRCQTHAIISSAACQPVAETESLALLLHAPSRVSLFSGPPDIAPCPRCRQNPLDPRLLDVPSAMVLSAALGSSISSVAIRPRSTRLQRQQQQPRSFPGRLPPGRLSLGTLPPVRVTGGEAFDAMLSPPGLAIVAGAVLVGGTLAQLMQVAAGLKELGNRLETGNKDLAAGQKRLEDKVQQGDESLQQMFVAAQKQLEEKVQQLDKTVSLLAKDFEFMTTAAGGGSAGQMAPAAGQAAPAVGQVVKDVVIEVIYELQARGILPPSSGLPTQGSNIGRVDQAVCPPSSQVSESIHSCKGCWCWWFTAEAVCLRLSCWCQQALSCQPCTLAPCVCVCIVQRPAPSSATPTCRPSPLFSLPCPLHQGASGGEE